MKNLLTGLFLCAFSFQTFAEGGKPEKFVEPKILMVTGKAWVKPSSGNKKPAKKNDLLREKVLLETEANAWLVVALTKNEKLLIAPESRVGLPVISWDDGSVERVELEKGRMRLLNMTSEGRQVVTLLSRDAYAEGDLVFQVEPSVPSVKLSVLEGRALFRGLENEEYLSLEAGDEATFKGSRENGELVMDVLLAGRRVIRGKMSEKSNITPSTREFWAKALDEATKHDKLAKIKAHKEALRKGTICKKPEAKFNECAWICENNPKKEKKKCRLDLPNVQCVRERCNADGKWSDRLVLTSGQSPCMIKPVVGACDY